MDKVNDMGFYAVPAVLIEAEQLESLVDSMVAEYVIVVLFYYLYLRWKRCEYIERGFRGEVVLGSVEMRFMRVGRRLT